MTHEAEARRSALAREASDLMRHSADFRHLLPEGANGNRTIIVVLPDDLMSTVFDKLEKYGAPAMIYTRSEDDRVFWITVETCESCQGDEGDEENVRINGASPVAILLDLLALAPKAYHLLPHYEFAAAPADPSPLGV